MKQVVFSIFSYLLIVSVSVGQKLDKTILLGSWTKIKGK